MSEEKFTPEEVADMDQKASEIMTPSQERQTEHRTESIDLYLEAIGENMDSLGENPYKMGKIYETAQAFDEVKSVYESSAHPKPLSIGRKTVELWPKDVEKTKARISESLNVSLKVLESRTIPQGALPDDQSKGIERQQSEISKVKGLIARVESGDKETILLYLRRQLQSDVEAIVQYDPKIVTPGSNPAIPRDLEQLDRARKIVLEHAVNDLDLIEVVSSSQG